MLLTLYSGYGSSGIWKLATLKQICSVLLRLWYLQVEFEIQAVNVVFTQPDAKIALFSSFVREYVVSWELSVQCRSSLFVRPGGVEHILAAALPRRQSGWSLSAPMLDPSAELELSQAV